MVSIVIATYKRNGSLKRCLLSILQQTLPPDEVIVVDNFPNPETKSLIEKFNKPSTINIRYLAEKRKGAALARNLGANEAKGSIIAFIDDDCRAQKNWVKEIDTFFKNHHRARTVLGKNLNGAPNNIYASVEHQLTEGFFTHYRYRTRDGEFSLAADSKNFALRKSVLIEENISFDNAFKPLEDVDLGFQLGRKNIPIFFLKEMAVYHDKKTNFSRSLKRYFDIGIASYLLETKWSHRPFVFWGLLITYRKKIKLDYLARKPLIYKAKFYLLKTINSIAEKAGVYWAKIWFNSWRRF